MGLPVQQLSHEPGMPCSAAPVSGESSTSEKEPSLSDEEDTTEMTELLHHMGEKD